MKMKLIKKKEVIDMKLMIASDIHGSAFYCEKMIEAYKREGARTLRLTSVYLTFLSLLSFIAAQLFIQIGRAHV